MKRLLLSYFFFFLFHSVFAQKQYFFYLESENGIPFYVRLGDKIYSSSSPGYLIFPNLSDSSYTLFIGIPSQGGNESRFQLLVQGNDHGYAIKARGSELELADLQSLIVIGPVHMPGTANVTYEPRKDAFSSMLSKASNDSSLLMVPVFSKVDPAPAVVQKQEVEPGKAVDKSIAQETSTPEPQQSNPDISRKNAPAEVIAVKDTIFKNTDTAALSSQQMVADNKPVPEKAEVLVQPGTKKESEGGSAEITSATSQMPGEELYKKSVVKKYSESSTSEGFGLVYFDAAGSQVDTIRMLIPNPKIVFRETDTSRKPDMVFMEVKKDPEPVKET